MNQRAICAGLDIVSAGDRNPDAGPDRDEAQGYGIADFSVMRAWQDSAATLFREALQLYSTRPDDGPRDEHARNACATA